MSSDEKPAIGQYSPTRRNVLLGGAALSAALFAPKVYAAAPPTAKVNTTGLAVTDTEVTVGILHSITGTMAISETGSVEAEKLAISQINAMGGVLGRKIKYIQEDGASDWPTFAEKAKKLLVENHVRLGDGLLDLGLAQGGAAGVRAVQRPACTTRPSTKASRSRTTSSTPARKRPSRSSPASTG